ncbi:thioredoxin [Candidatus Woesearchaeota archaeon]|nr:thioredoxin [Candidatus Woesearchaeota archaeon]
MKVKIFWQENCPKCPPVKELGEELKQLGADVSAFDIKDVDGLAEAVNHDVMSTPSIILVDDDGNEVKSWTDNVPPKEEIEKILES